MAGRAAFRWRQYARRRRLRGLRRRADAGGCRGMAGAGTEASLAQSGRVRGPGRHHPLGCPEANAALRAPLGAHRVLPDVRRRAAVLRGASALPGRWLRSRPSQGAAGTWARIRDGHLSEDRCLELRGCSSSVRLWQSRCPHTRGARRSFAEAACPFRRKRRGSRRSRRSRRSLAGGGRRRRGTRRAR
jgi:hypothetical protein